MPRSDYISVTWSRFRVNTVPAMIMARLRKFVVLAATAVVSLVLIAAPSGDARTAHAATVTIPRLSASYATGIGHNTTADFIAETTMEDIVETPQGSFTGMVTFFPPAAAFTAPISGTVSGDTVTWTETAPAADVGLCKGGCNTETFTGTIGAQGVISGSYTVYPREGPDEYGTDEYFPTIPPEVFGPSGAVQAPASTKCLSRRSFIIHIRHYPKIQYKRVSVILNGKQIAVAHGQTAFINLRGLPKGRYTVQIMVTTTTGATISGTRTYHTCAARVIHPSRPPKL